MAQNLETIDNTYTILSIKNSEGPYKTYCARHNQTQVLHLIEVYHENIPANLINIMNNLIAINHPNVTHIIGHGNGPIVLNNHPPVNRPYIVYENVNHSDLYSYIHIQRFTEIQAKMIFKKILEGVQALHNANICHRDLGIHNILLDDNYNPKIMSFYFSCINMNNLNQRVGRLPFMAPEILSNQPYDGIKADVFSLGQILFNLVTGFLGFETANINDNFYRFIIQHNIAQYWQNIDNHINLNLSQNLKNLFISMVNPNPAQRPTVAQILLNNPWIQEVNNLPEEQRNAFENQIRNEFLRREPQIQQQNPQIHNQINEDNQVNTR